MRCPYRRVRSARHTRYFAAGDQPDEILCLRLCATHQQLFDRTVNEWINNAEVVSLEFARTKPRNPKCMRCLRVRRADHARIILVGENPQDVCRTQLCNDHVESFDVEFGVWCGLAVTAETQPQWSRALRLTRSEFGDDAALRIRELKERAAGRQPRSANVDDATEGEVRLGPLSDQWRFSLHAQQRAEERGFAPNQVLWAASHPHFTAPTTGSNAGPDLFYHVSGDCCAVVNVRQKIIITVYNKFEYLCQISHGPRTATAKKGIA
jgi:hypothetical protein